MTESALTTTPGSSVYKNEGSFELHQRMAKSLAQSNLVPQQYQAKEDYLIVLLHWKWQTA